MSKETLFDKMFKGDNEFIKAFKKPRIKRKLERAIDSAIDNEHDKIDKLTVESMKLLENVEELSEKKTMQEWVTNDLTIRKHHENIESLTNLKDKIFAVPTDPETE